MRLCRAICLGYRSIQVAKHRPCCKTLCTCFRATAGIRPGQLGLSCCAACMHRFLPAYTHQPFYPLNFIHTCQTSQGQLTSLHLRCRPKAYFTTVSRRPITVLALATTTRLLETVQYIVAAHIRCGAVAQRGKGIAESFHSSAVLCCALPGALLSVATIRILVRFLPTASCSI